MRIENDGYNIYVEFIGRAEDGLNIWDKFKNDANNIEIFLGFSVEDGWGTSEGMCIPLKNILEMYTGLSMVLNNTPFSYSCNFPFEYLTEELITVSAEAVSDGVRFFFRIYDTFDGYVELTEIMKVEKFNDILSELRTVLSS